MVRARFVEASRCEALHFSVGDLAKLEQASRAAWYVRHRALLAAGTSSEAKTPPELDRESKELRDRMFKCAEYMLEDDVDAMKVIDEVRPGSGYLDRANDLYALAELYAKHRDTLARDGRNWRKGDAAKARRLHGALLEALGLSPLTHGVDWVSMCTRAWHLLRVTYDEVESVGRCLFRHEDPDRLFPNLVAAAREGALDELSVSRAQFGRCKKVG